MKTTHERTTAQDFAAADLILPWAAGSIEIPGLSVTLDPGSKDVRRAAGRAFDLTRKICTHSAF